MDKLEKVIKGLEHLHDNSGCIAVYDNDCGCCPYKSVNGCVDQIIKDALELLKAQEPRVMTLEEAEVNMKDGPFIIFEVRDSTGTEVDFGVLVDDCYEMSEGSVLTVADFWMMKDVYGKRFRLWTSRPTDEQREAIPWN